MLHWHTWHEYHFTQEPADRVPAGWTCFGRWFTMVIDMVWSPAGVKTCWRTGKRFTAWSPGLILADRLSLHVLVFTSGNCVIAVSWHTMFACVWAVAYMSKRMTLVWSVLLFADVVRLCFTLNKWTNHAVSRYWEHINFVTPLGSCIWYHAPEVCTTSTQAILGRSWLFSRISVF